MRPEAITTTAELVPGSIRAFVAAVEESWRDPEAFVAALQTWLAGPANAVWKSVPGRRYDLYHDWVTRHVGAGITALRIHDRRIDGEWSSLSYDELDLRCALRAAAWARQGVNPGNDVCVVLPFGIEAIVSLLAGVRIGACMSWLEPHGLDHVERRLHALAPAFVASEPHHRPWFGGLEAVELAPETFASSDLPSSHTYGPEDCCIRSFSPLRRPPEQPVALTAADAYLGALRDGAATFALRRGDAFAAPGFGGEQYQPALLFAALAVGATFVHVPAAEIARDPFLLDAVPLRTFGLDHATCEARLRGGPRPAPPWQHVFRNPEEPTDWEAWRELVEVHGFARIALSNAIVESASGGALLSSPRRMGFESLAALLHVVPAAGRPWAWLDFTRTGQRAIGDAGVFAPIVRAPGGEDAPGDPQYIVLGRRRAGEYLYGGTLEPRRSGRVVPIDEVIAALADCPFLRGASVVATPAGGATLAQRFVLLGFVGHEPRMRFDALFGPRSEELQRMLTERLGAERLPDHIELFPLVPRLREGEVDHAWCQTQYLGGALFAKARTPVFHRITELRRLTR